MNVSSAHFRLDLHIWRTFVDANERLLGIGHVVYESTMHNQCVSVWDRSGVCSTARLHHIKISASLPCEIDAYDV